MATHPDKPGLPGLLRGEGEDQLMCQVAWLAVLVVVFAVAWELSALLAGKI